MILRVIVHCQNGDTVGGGYIIERIEENLTYDYLHASEDNLWSILYLTGYLTKVRDRDIKSRFRMG